MTDPKQPTAGSSGEEKPLYHVKIDANPKAVALTTAAERDARGMVTEQLAPEDVTAQLLMRERNTIFWAGERNTTRVLDDPDLDPRSVLHIKDCHDCTLTLAASATITKMFVEHSTNCTVFIDGRVLTKVVEVWRSQGLALTINTPVETLQVDEVSTSKIVFKSPSMYKQIVWHMCTQTTLEFTDTVGLKQLSKPFLIDIDAAKEADAVVDKEVDQFFLRVVHERYLQEKVVRLQGGFATTEREAAEYDRRLEENVQKLAQAAGITIGAAKDKKPVAGRNDACPCGSGKKYKKCCGGK